MKRLLLAAVGALALLAGPAGAATVLGASAAACPPGPNCLAAARGFVQVIPASAFASGGLTINTLDFDRAILGARQDAVFRITFWVHGGGDLVGSFGRFMVDGMADEAVRLSGSPFFYDPAWGDLYIKIEVAETPGGGDLPALPRWWANGPAEAAFALADDEALVDDVVTIPDQPAVAPGPVGEVPEPAAWALMILGFGAVGAALRRRALQLALA